MRRRHLPDRWSGRDERDPPFSLRELLGSLTNGTTWVDGRLEQLLDRFERMP